MTRRRGPANSLHASAYYSEYNERFDEYATGKRWEASKLGYCKHFRFFYGANLFFGAHTAFHFAHTKQALRRYVAIKSKYTVKCIPGKVYPETFCIASKQESQLMSVTAR